MMENQHYVYGLYSTRHLKKTFAPKIKYIGRTDNPTTRLSSHINTSLNMKQSPLCEWIRNEMDKGGKIEMTLLHQCGELEIKEQERIFIEDNKGRNLLNVEMNSMRTPTNSYKRVKQLTKDNFDLSRQVKILEQHILDLGFELPYIIKDQTD